MEHTTVMRAMRASNSLSGGGVTDTRDPSLDQPQTLPAAEPVRRHWWQRAVVYQIAVKSFQDSNGDGKGDLPGLIGHIDYLSWLGVNAVWLSPIQPSPMRDFGYDIADFCAVDPV